MLRINQHTCSTFEIKKTHELLGGISSIYTSARERVTEPMQFNFSVVDKGDDERRKNVISTVYLLIVVQ